MLNTVANVAAGEALTPLKMDTIREFREAQNCTSIFDYLDTFDTSTYYIKSLGEQNSFTLELQLELEEMTQITRFPNSLEILREFIYGYVSLCIPLYLICNWLMNLLFEHNVIETRTSLVVEDIYIERSRY